MPKKKNPLGLPRKTSATSASYYLKTKILLYPGGGPTERKTRLLTEKPGIRTEDLAPLTDGTFENRRIDPVKFDYLHSRFFGAGMSSFGWSIADGLDGYAADERVPVRRKEGNGFHFPKFSVRRPNRRTSPSPPEPPEPVQPQDAPPEANVGKCDRSLF